MKHTLLHRIATGILVFGLFLYAVPLVHANTLTIPHQYQYPGLTFSQPLTYTNPLPSSQPAETISFAPQNKIEITKDNSKKTLAAQIVSPTQSKSEPTITKISTKTASTIPAQQPTPTMYLQPKGTKTQSVIATPTPTKAPQPTQKSSVITPTTAPTVSTPKVTTTGGISAAKLFSMVNSYRQSKGLAALQQDDRTCSLASARSTEIAGEMSAGTLHSGMYGRNLPYWNTENAIALPSEEAAFNWWINEPIHRQAIESPSHTTSCVACSGNYCVQEFTSYQPK